MMDLLSHRDNSIMGFCKPQEVCFVCTIGSCVLQVVAAIWYTAKEGFQKKVSEWFQSAS